MMDEAALVQRVEAETRARRRSYMVQVLVGRVLLIVAVLGLWQYASGTLLDPFFFSKPTAILDKLWQMLRDGSLAKHVNYTLIEIGSGYVLGVAIGLLLAFGLTVNETLMRIVQPLLTAFYAIPRIALAPLFIMWFGLGLAPKVAIAALLVFFIVFMNTVHGIRSVERGFLDMVTLMGGSHRTILSKVVLPSALPAIITSLHTTVPLAVLGAVLGEFLSGNRGIGFMINDATAYFDTAGSFAGVVILMVMTVILSGVVGYFESRALSWRPPSRERSGTGL